MVNTKMTTKKEIKLLSYDFFGYVFDCIRYVCIVGTERGGGGVRGEGGGRGGGGGFTDHDMQNHKKTDPMYP